MNACISLQQGIHPLHPLLTQILVVEPQKKEGLEADVPKNIEQAIVDYYAMLFPLNKAGKKGPVSCSTLNSPLKPLGFTDPISLVPVINRTRSSLGETGNLLMSPWSPFFNIPFLMPQDVGIYG